MRRLDSRALVAVVTSLAVFSSVVVAFAVDYIAPVTDVISIIEQATLRSTAQENLPLSDDAYQNTQSVEDSLTVVDDAYQNNQISTDNIPLTDSAVPASQARDVVGMSESADVQSGIFYQVSASDIFPISDRPSPGSSVFDVVDVSEKVSLATAVTDILDLIEDAFLVFFLNDALSLTEDILGVEEPFDTDEGKTDGGDSGRVVIVDESYFVDNPLSRFEMRSLHVTDNQGSNIVQAKVGQLINIGTTVQNYQNADQTFTLIIQVTNEEGYAIQILESSGTIKAGNSVRVNQQWEVPAASAYQLKIMVWTLLDTVPVPLAESVSETIEARS